MYEIVVVRNVYYKAGCEVMADRLIESTEEKSKFIWWFDGPFTAKDMKSVMNPHPTEEGVSIMNCDAIRFEFDFVPNLTEPNHFSPGSSYMGDEFKYGLGSEIFEESMPQLVEVVRRKAKADEFFPETDFYALYDVELDEFRDDDGGLDMINVIPTLLGELDMSKIELALVETQKGN